MREYINTVDTVYTSLCRLPLRRFRYKVELMDWNEFVIDEIFDELIEGGTITISRSQGTRRSCTLTFVDDGVLTEYSTKFWYTKKFKLWMGLENEYNGDVYWFAQGVYLTTSVSRSNGRIDISAVDKFGLFTAEIGASILTAEHKISRDKEIITAIKDILMIDMGNGRPCDPIAPVCDLSLCGVEVPYEISVTSGQYMGDILTELALCLGADIYYDGDGRLNVTGGTIDTGYSSRGAVWVFESGDANLLSLGIDADYSTAINQVTVFGTDADEVHHYYTATNDDPTSPISRQAVGTRAADTMESDMCYSEERCREYAEYWLRQKSLITLSVSMECVCLPQLDVDKVVSVVDKVSGDANRYIVTSINMPFGSEGNMTVSLTNVVDLPYYNEI